jgi:outer membrane protein TolC
VADSELGVKARRRRAAAGRSSGAPGTGACRRNESPSDPTSGKVAGVFRNSQDERAGRSATGRWVQVGQTVNVGRTIRGGRLVRAAAAGLLVAGVAFPFPGALAVGPGVLISDERGNDIDQVVQAAVEANPSIHAAAAAVEAATARSRVETSYPDPTITGTWWPEKESGNKPEILELMLEQGVPFPGTLGAVGRVRDAEETAARIALRRTIRDVSLKVRESAVELVYLRSAARIAAGNRELLGRLRAAGETGYAAGKTGLYDALRAQSQESQTLFDERLLAELEAAETARLNSLLSRPADAPVGPIDLRPGRALSAGQAQIAAWAADARQEVLLARAEGARARAERRVAAFGYLPELMLGVGYMQESELADMEAVGRWEFQLGLTLPVNLGPRRAPAKRGPWRWSARPRTWPGRRSARTGSGSGTRSGSPRSTATRCCRRRPARSGWPRPGTAPGREASRTWSTPGRSGTPSSSRWRGPARTAKNTSRASRRSPNGR